MFIRTFGNNSYLNDNNHIQIGDEKISYKKTFTVDELVNLNKKIRANYYPTKNLFTDIPNRGTAYIISDLHGNIESLKSILSITNFDQRAVKDDIHLIFLGDYVDKGYNNLLMLYSIFKLKKLYPENIVILRGNHETNFFFNKFMSFQREIKQNYSRSDSRIILKEFNKTFENLPIIASGENGLVAMHGGPPNSLSLYGITQIGIHEILWSDIKKRRKKTQEKSFWRMGKGCKFSVNDIDIFLENLNKTFLLRGHSHTTKGIDIINNNIMTVISANSLNRFGNSLGKRGQAGFVEISLEKELNHISQVKTIFLE